ncbi:MAG: phosphatidylinositol dimannoside acyltransferase [Chloroflexia bacterium]|nr:phosphatidylinositol dimannoside acyltransferase [Chloroflexia bacterium]
MSVPTPDTVDAARPRHFRTRMMGVLRVLIALVHPIIGHWIADRLGDVVMRIAHKSRRAVINNMHHVLGPVPRDVLKRNVRGVFRNLVRAYFDLCRAPSLSNEQIDRMVDFDEKGWQRVVELHEQGKGIILVSGHYGAFDEITQVISRRGLPLTVLIAQFKPAWASDFITQLRAARGLQMVLVSEEEGHSLNLAALKESIKLLRRGELLGVIADRNLEEHGVSIPFFGEEAVMAAGVAKMALRTKSTIVTSFCTRLPRKRYSVVFDEPIEPVGSASNEEDIRNLLIKIFARFEHYISRNPDQWLLLQPVWPDGQAAIKAMKGAK